MNDYKRLTIKNCGSYITNCNNCPSKHLCRTDNCCDTVMTQRLGELEDKIENGTLLELPKIGQTLYGVIPWRKEVREITIDNIGVFSNCIVVFDAYDNDYVLNDYAFYTEAEAQKKLKELQK